MSIRPKLLVSAGIAIAGLGLVGAGAGATFTAQVAEDTTILSGGVGLSLNGQTGSGVQVQLNGNDLGSHFTPISKDLLLKNTGTLDLASTFLSITATGCDGGKGAPLAQALDVTLTDETNHRKLYDGDLCSMDDSVTGHGASGEKDHGFVSRPTHPGVGGQLPRKLLTDEAISYRVVIKPSDGVDGLPPQAQYTRTSVKLVFTGFDY